MKESKSTLVLFNPNSDTVNDPSVGEDVQPQSQEVVKQRSFLKGTSVKCITILILVFIGLYCVSLASAQQPAASSIWQVQHPPFDKTIGLEINAISAQSDENVWAVGNGSAHWDGSSWTLVPIVRHDSLNLAGWRHFRQATFGGWDLSSPAEAGLSRRLNNSMAKPGRSFRT